MGAGLPFASAPPPATSPSSSLAAGAAAARALPPPPLLARRGSGGSASSPDPWRLGAAAPPLLPPPPPPPPPLRPPEAGRRGAGAGAGASAAPVESFQLESLAVRAQGTEPSRGVAGGRVFASSLRSALGWVEQTGLFNVGWDGRLHAGNVATHQHSHARATTTAANKTARHPL
jgi:hypothetical protein